jgi:hypothetical protein
LLISFLFIEHSHEVWKSIFFSIKYDVRKVGRFLNIGGNDRIADLYFRHVTYLLKMQRAEKKSSETNVAYVRYQVLQCKCNCRVRIEIIHPKQWFYSLLASVFGVRMRIIISLGLRPDDIILGNRTPNNDVYNYAYKTIFKHRRICQICTANICAHYMYSLKYMHSFP